MIGRRGIDNTIVCHAKAMKALVVDITGTGHHIHQGVDGFYSIRRAIRDKDYNMPIFKRYRKFTNVLYHADYVFGVDSKVIKPR